MTPQETCLEALKRYQEDEQGHVYLAEQRKFMYGASSQDRIDEGNKRLDEIEAAIAWVKEQK